jgi:AGCS family alanine or glycine:cation symporter
VVELFHTLFHKDVITTEQLNVVLGTIGGYVWGIPLLVLLVGTGLYLTIRIKFLSFRRLGMGFKLAFFKNDKAISEGEGDISNFQSLMTALAATIGTGNIIGVATAILAGGPGALFWMWVSALVGMATKYSEAILAVRFREVNPAGQMAGGPMYYIKNGMHNKWLAWIFALLGSVAAFGIGNLVQVNAITVSLTHNFGMSNTASGICLMLITGYVVLGGIKSIGKASGIIVPFMAVGYMAAGLYIIITNFSLVPQAFATVLGDAFTGQALAGGAVGSVIRFGVARGVFSNEAGLGSAPIAAAAAKTDMPGRQALVSMIGTFIDTIMVCSMTGLIIVMSGLWQTTTKAQGGTLTSRAFEQFLPGVGNGIVDFGILFFAFSTILGWCYYGEKCCEYILGSKAVKPYRIVYSLAVFLGAVVELQIVWNIADIFNGLMAIPNLIALLALSSVIVSETDLFEKKLDEEKNNK